MSVNKIILKTCIDLCENNQWVFREIEDLLLFEVTLKNGRSQACVAVVSDCDYGKMIEIVSSCGAVATLSREILLELLAYNINLSYARVQVDANHETINVCARTLAAAASLNELQTMVEEVAVHADYIEKQIFGTDDN